VVAPHERAGAGNRNDAEESDGDDDLARQRHESSTESRDSPRAASTRLLYI
jgi:hypothetical protein